MCLSWRFCYKYGYYFVFKFSGHVVSNCVRKFQCDSPFASCHLEDSPSSTQQSSCETTCINNALCQMYYFTGSSCSLYNCQTCSFDDKSGQHLVYTCTPGKFLRTSDSLNEGLPIKMTRRSFKESDIFSMKKIVGSTLDLSTKAVFSLDKYQLKNMG